MTEALLAAREGAQAAADHAERETEQWKDRALKAFKEYALNNTEFLTEDVRVWAHQNGLPAAPDPRAWGYVSRAAVNSRYVEISGYRNTRIPPAHAGPRAVYRSLVRDGIEVL